MEGKSKSGVHEFRMSKIEESQILLQRSLANKFDDFQSQYKQQLSFLQEKLNQEVFDRKQIS